MGPTIMAALVYLLSLISVISIFMEATFGDNAYYTLDLLRSGEEVTDDQGGIRKGIG